MLSWILAMNFTVAFGPTPELPAARPLMTDAFVVNAQYRGAIRKGFAGIGEGSVTYGLTGPGAFTVKITGEVRHPDQEKVYTFKVSQAFTLAGSRLHLVEERKKLNPAAREQEPYIRPVVPFACLARFLPPPGEGEEPTRSFLYDGTAYLMRYRQSEKQQTEVELFQGDVSMGKFFLTPGWQVGKEGLEKFRIPFPLENIIVSFVLKGSRAAGTAAAAASAAATP